MEVLLYSILWFFAIYGIIQMTQKWWNYYKGIGDLSASTYTVLTVKNQQDNVEGLIRSTVWRALSQSGSNLVSDIIVVDLGSEDETLPILHKLANEYHFLYVMDKEQYIKSLQNLQ